MNRQLNYKAFLSVIITLGLFCISSCKKIENVKRPDNISGAIIVPSGSIIDMNNLRVVNYNDEVKVANNRYEVKDTSEFSVQYVLDKEGEVRLMGYLYPGQTDFTIDAKSTTLALLMNTPFCFQLGDKVKLDFARRILDDDGFNALVLETENLIKNGISPFDTMQKGYIVQISNYFKAITAKRSAQLNGDPERMYRLGNTLYFQNPGKSYNTVVGVYKNGVRDKVININRVAFVPKNIFEIFDAFNNQILADFTTKEYKMDIDGQYEIKLRTGVSNDNSFEDKEALIENIKDLTLDIIDGILTGVELRKDIYNSKSSCAYDILTNLYKHIKSIDDLGSGKISTNRVWSIAESFYNTYYSSLVDCYFVTKSKETYLKTVFEKAARFMKVMDIIGTGSNILIGVGQIYADKPASDTCFLVQAGTVSNCNCAGPYTLTFNGNNQSGLANTWLSNPLSLIAKDKDGLGASCLTVEWSVASGGGKLEKSLTSPDDNGKSTNKWQIGTSGVQRVKAVVKDKDGKEITGSPVYFVSKIDPCYGLNVIKDSRDGQTYKIVTIGNQTWFAENLRYSGTLPQIVDWTKWENDSSGAWCYYGDIYDSSKSSYGKLYNWYSTKAENLCPAGWHIPTYSEWNTLIDYLGGSGVAGDKLKCNFSMGGSNESCFTALPTGWRSARGGYHLGNGDGAWTASWWSSTKGPLSRSGAGCRVSNKNSSVSTSDSYNANLGWSIRCIKN